MLVTSRFDSIITHYWLRALIIAYTHVSIRNVMLVTSRFDSIITHYWLKLKLGILRSLYYVGLFVGISWYIYIYIIRHVLLPVRCLVLMMERMLIGYLDFFFFFFFFFSLDGLRTEWYWEYNYACGLFVLFFFFFFFFFFFIVAVISIFRCYSLTHAKSLYDVKL